MTSYDWTITSTGNTSGDQWFGGVGTFGAVGTWGSATIKLQHTPDGTNWIDVDGADSDATFTADDVTNFQLPVTLLRLQTSGATTTTSVSVSIRQ